MDGFVIPTTHTEEAITDEMLDQIEADIQKDMVEEVHDSLGFPPPKATQQATCGTDAWQEAFDQPAPAHSLLPDGLACLPTCDHNDLDEITSDDSGDLAFFTANVTDASVYELVRDYIAYTKQQEKEMQDLEKVCSAIEDEQRRLWAQAVSATRAEAQENALDEGAPQEVVAVFDPSQPKQERLNSAIDEFDDGGLTTTRPCVYMDPHSAEMRRDPFRYSTPSIDVGDAVFTSVFKTGFLFMAASPDGAWVFFNDSEKYEMSITYVFGENSAITPGPRARMSTLPNNEKQVSMVVMPEETDVLIRGVVNGFRNASVARPVDPSFVNEHVRVYDRRIEASLGKLAARLRKASAAFVTVEEALSVAEETDGFIDPSFPPTRSSLCRPAVDEVFLWALPWRRPDAYLSAEDAQEVRLFRGQVLPIDASPGDGGDYYFCSAARIAAEYPMRIRSLFRHPVSVTAGKAERRQHAYRVTLNKGGWWTCYVLDDYLPASKKGPDYGRCEHDLRKLWYPLLEKAYAKSHNSYAAIQFGDPLEALQDMLGFPTCRFDEEWNGVFCAPDSDNDGSGATDSLQRRKLACCDVNSASRDALFQQLSAHLEAGYIVLLSTPEEGAEASLTTAMGLSYGMSYAVQRVVRRDGVCLVQIRCPTMIPDWCGLWSPDSAEWQSRPSLQQECGLTEAHAVEDTMWLDWTEAMQLFDGGGVCYTRFAYEDYRVRGHFAPEMGPTVALEIHVKGNVPLEAYCVLSQEDDRGTDEASPNHSLNPLMLLVTYPKTPGVQQVSAVCSPNPDAPADKLNFVIGRDVALWYRFSPCEQPYYVIPRARSITTLKSYTLGLLCNMVVDDHNASVRCVTVTEDSPILRNKLGFGQSDMTSAKPTAIQHRRPDGSIREQIHTTLVFSS